MSTAKLIDGRLLLEGQQSNLTASLKSSPDAHLSKIERIELLERKIELQEGLPHIHGWKFYPWAREYFEARNKETFLCAANQISKSSTQIRKMIHWATATDLWPELWPYSTPRQFWYLYPTRDVCHIEVTKKWVPEFLPRGKYKEDPVYGWRAEYSNKRIWALHFNSGVSIYFKTYAQDVKDLQSGTCWMMACFAAGTKVLTSTGLRNIEDIKIGESVLTRTGWRLVKATMSKEAKVITRRFANGEEITATPDHRFWTENREWVSLGQLNPDDVLVTIPEWPSLKRSFFSKAGFTTVIQNIKTGVAESILSGALGISMWRSGSRIISEAFQRATSYITSTLSLSIIGLRTSSYSLAQSIPVSTSWLSGRSKVNGSFRALPAEKSSRQEVPRSGAVDSVRQSVRNPFSLLSLIVSAVKNLLSPAKIATRSFAPSSVLIGQRAIEKPQRVYDLSIEGDPSFFANGYLVHNCDEETPEELMSELNMRLAASDGYLSAVFTPTMGSEYWRECIEETGKNRRFPNSWRKQVSMYDCLQYEDGTPSGWTPEKINRAINSCKSPQDVERRVYGKFVVSEGLKYPGFHRLRNRTEGHPLPKNWSLWCGVDPGSGGDNHPAAISVVAVSPDFTKGRVFRGWRGDGAQTTAGDVVKRAIQMTKDLEHCQIYYDWGCRDFYLIAQAAGLHVEPAEKSHLIGEQMINVLFKNQMLMIYDYPELDPLCTELATLRNDVPKNKAKDDFADSLRYAVSLVPWNWNAIKSDFVIEAVAKKPKRERGVDIRRQFWEGEKDEEGLVTADEELTAWNDLMRPDFGT
jgi:hypothetical protein